MSLKTQIDEDLVAALKGKNALDLSVLRMVKSAIKNAEIAKGDNLSEAEVVNILEKQAKQRRDSISQYQSGNREDLAENERAELVVIEKYLPKMLTEAELNTLIDQVILSLKAETMSEMGQVIKEVISKANGQAEGKRVSELVKAKLA